MKVNSSPYTSIWYEAESDDVKIIDQRWLPHEFKTAKLNTLSEVAMAIKDMWVRGAPLIGATAAFGMYIALRDIEDSPQWQKELVDASKALLATRPTAVNLKWAIDRQMNHIKDAINIGSARKELLAEAQRIREEDIAISESIGNYGLTLIEQIYAQTGETVNILTHCNAGWLATVDWGTATAPIYKAHRAGIPVHVWVDETRPRNQGARITAFELLEEGIAHTVIVDNVGGHLMQNDQVDMCIVGTDRTTFTGDVANKIGTYLKALAAYDNGVPFYVALPSTTVDWEIEEGADIPIEERNADEVQWIQGKDKDGILKKVLLTPEKSAASNYAFDVTPREYITALITEKGICAADEESISALLKTEEET